MCRRNWKHREPAWGAAFHRRESHGLGLSPEVEGTAVRAQIRVRGSRFQENSVEGATLQGARVRRPESRGKTSGPEAGLLGAREAN